MKSNLYNNITKVLFFGILFCGLYSCKPTKYVPDESYLLNKNKVSCNNKSINSDELYSYVKQNPNRRILHLFRFHLWVYNITNSGKERKWKTKIKEIVGEEPVVYEEFLKNKTTRQLSQYLKNKGYYNAIVKDTVVYKKKKAEVEYVIDSKKPYIINNIEYEFEDESLKSIAIADSKNSMLKPKSIFDVDILQLERNRIATTLNNSGYYYFTKEFIYYEVDSNLNSSSVNLKLIVKKNFKRVGEKEIIFTDHNTYKVNKVFIYCDYNPKEILSNPELYKQHSDTIIFKNLNFIYRDKLTIKPWIISQSNYINPDMWYQKNEVDRTYKALSSLGIFKLINIIFEEKEGNVLDCIIQLTPFTLQSYTIELEGTNSSGNLGLASNLLYQHKSLFKSAEVFDSKFKGAIEAQSTTVKDKDGIIQDDIPFNTIEIGAQTGISFQQFLLPFRSENFTKKYHPKTKIQISYNFQNRPDYSRTLFKNSFGYFWDGSSRTKHIINPVEINSVKIHYNSLEFINAIKDPFIKASYTDHLITVSSYSFIFNTQNIKKNRDFVYFNWNAESSGNILTGLNNTFGSTKIDNSYQLLDSKYSQYLKSDIDFRFYNIINKANKTVYRVFAGIGYPYGNLNVMPFEKKYFSGGANSIRAWQVRTLGPGSFKDTLNVPNQLGDVKLELNLEYRFKLIWVIEGAFFVDAGNIWAVNNVDTRPGAVFKINEFYNQFAVGTGFGTRFDFSFFVFRFDLGLKIREPEYEAGKRIIPFSRKFNGNDFGFNVGIGYPF